MNSAPGKFCKEDDFAILKPEAERVGKSMIRPVLALERLTFQELDGKVGYRWGLIWSLSPG